MKEELDLWKELKEFIAHLRDKYPKATHKLTTDDLAFMQKVGENSITNETLYYFELINSEQPLGRECETIFAMIIFWLEKSWDAEGIASWITGYLDVQRKYEKQVKEELIPFLEKIIEAYDEEITRLLLKKSNDGIDPEPFP